MALKTRSLKSWSDMFSPSYFVSIMTQKACEVNAILPYPECAGYRCLHLNRGHHPRRRLQR